MRTELGDAPKAVLMISGHWEGEGFAISSGAKPGMIYDYSGFPEYLYHITYGAPGSPDLAKRVLALFCAQAASRRNSMPPAVLTTAPQHHEAPLPGRGASCGSTVAGCWF